MEPKARMTFRFDGTAPANAEPSVRGRETTREAAPNGNAAGRQEQPATADEYSRRQPSAPRSAEYQAWNSPYQDDIRALEEMIRHSDPAPVAGFNWRSENAEAAAPEPVREAEAAPAPAPARPRMATARRDVPPQADWRGPVPEEPAHSPEAEGSPARRPAQAPEPQRHAAQRREQPRAARPSAQPVDSRQMPPQTRGFSQAELPDGPARKTAPRRPQSLPAENVGQRPAPAPLRQSSGSSHRPASPPTGRTIPFPAANRWEERDGPEIDEELLPDAYDEERDYGEYGEYADLEHGWLPQERYTRNDRPSWPRVFVTVIGAIATGGLFGYMLLALFSGAPLFPKKAANDAEIPAMTVPYADSGASSGTGTKGAGAPAGSAGDPSGTASGAPASAVPGLSLFMLQYGVFQTEQSMNEAAGQLRDKGFAAATDSTDGYRVYAGVAPTKESAARLASSLDGTQVYVKALSSGEMQIPESGGGAYLKDSEALAAKIVGYSAAALSGEKAATGDDIQSIRTAHQVWLESAQATGSWSEGAKQEAADENEHLNAAVSALNDYSDSPSDKLLWEAQAHAMDAVLADLQLRAALQAGTGK